MAKTNFHPQVLSDLVTELPAEARIFLYMENLRTGSRQELLTGDESERKKRSVLQKFGNAVVSSVVKAGKAMRIIYLDEQRTETFAARLETLDYGEQLQLL